MILPDPYEGYPFQPEAVTKWKVEHDHENIEKILIDRNCDCEHFRLAQGTPLPRKRCFKPSRSPWIAKL